ncbi:hypothetical protein, conserved [Babesia bigemina]|uniref:Uncharacterized protein n=1 Tax=Babesia bigemina TaxID=5866 RepID=A0A061BT11_BABBI|nr:hypothetical protein, conserved [Babesia bigemina]CDR71638.1 hypothetical protein, conserved [Babesia bigemina]|eukprot:XP_012770585.1 hypothetical protein, conserved [Babesia bigemina]
MKLIDEDKISGTKGLLNKIETWFPQHGTPILFKTPLSYESVTTEFKYLLDSLLEYTEEQVKTPYKTPLKPAENDNSIKVYDVKYCADKLLSQLTFSNHFDQVFSDNLTALRKQLTTFTPSKFNGIHNPALADALRAGLTDCCGQLNHAYVNSYSGLTVDWSKTINGKPQLTDDAERCAKLFLTCLSTLFEYLSKLMNECQHAWISDKIHSTTDLGKWFGECGFHVSTSDANRDGELRNESKLQGRNILPLITKDNHVFNRYYVGNLKDIFGYLHDYLRVCHLTPRPKPRSPCSVYDMLCWLTGLTYRSYYQDLLLNSFSDLLDKPEKSDDAFAVDGIGLEIQTAKSLLAYPQTITAANLTDAITEVCYYAEDVLITVLGHGDADCTYAVEHSNNSLNLYYPPRSEDCLQMIIDVLRSMLQPLTFLKKQCALETKYYGWQQCTYGSGVQPSCWQCGEHSSIYPSSSHDCSGTSPLQLYLTDSLGGMLPHSLSSIGCKSSCSTCTKSSPGMPCLTPLGFSRFSRGTRTGKDLSNVLTKFLSNDHVAWLLTLVPKPPSTLPEHYGFVTSLVLSSVVPLTQRQATHKSVADAFKKCISEQTIDLYNNPTDLTNALGNAYGCSQTGHEAKSHLPPYADLSSISMTNTCPDQDVHCAPYIDCLSANCYKYMAKQHANLYFSWSIYLPWNLWKCLCSLLDAFGSINCKSFGCPGCSCTPSSHGAKHNCSCRALVCCRAVLPTFYRYGFTFKDPKMLLDGKNRKRCSHFYTQLESVVKSTYFTKLFDQCDMILWRIREPFSYLVLALWLLSLLYLLHIMVIRLDLLHIKSHLHSPSSHRIAAQSLLAAARVGKLGRVFYLQP